MVSHRQQPGNIDVYSRVQIIIVIGNVLDSLISIVKQWFMKKTQLLFRDAGKGVYSVLVPSEVTRTTTA